MRETSSSRDEVAAEVIRMVKNVAAGWDFGGEIDENTRLFSDLNWQSVDMVVLAHDVQEYYHRALPFVDFFSGLGRRERPGVTVGELVDFVAARLASSDSRVGR